MVTDTVRIRRIPDPPGLVVIALRNFALFHSVAELISIGIGFCVFALAWTGRRLRHSDNGYLLILGISVFAASIIDLIHTLAYRGVGVFPGYDSNLPTQLWIAARYLQAFSLLYGSLVLYRPPNSVLQGRYALYWLFTAFAAITGVLVWSCFDRVFPTSYVEGVGLTPFKVVSEYVIVAILIGAMLLFWQRRDRFESDVALWLLVSIGATIGSELFFTWYVSVFDFPNLIGHLLKIASFAALYRAIVITGIERPASLLFRSLAISEQLYRELAENVQDYIVRFDRQHRYLYANATLAAWVGMTQQGFHGKTLGDIDGEDERSRVWESLIEQVFATGLPQEGVFEWKSVRGNIILDWRLTPEKLNGEVVSVLGVGRDITRSRETDRILREQQAELSAIYENAPIMMVVIDKERRIRRVNGYAHAITGVRPEDMIGLCWGEAVHCANVPEPEQECGTGPHCETCVLRRVQGEALDPGIGVTQVEAHLPFMVDGRREDHHFLLSTAPLVVGPEPTVLISLLDITKRVRAEQALRTSQALLDETQRIAWIGGWTLAVMTENLEWTAEVYRIHELSPDVRPALHRALDYYDERDGPRLEQAIQRAFESGDSYDLELRLITATGNHLWVRTQGRPEFREGSIVRLSGTIQDVTQRVLNQEELRRAHAELEVRAEERTRELTEANRTLITVSVSERRQRRLAETLIEATVSLSSSLELNQVLDGILEQTARVIACQGVAVLTLQGGLMRLSRHRGLDSIPGALDVLSRGIPAASFAEVATRALDAEPALAESLPESHGWIHVEGLDGLVCLPAILTSIGEQAIGLLSITSDPPADVTGESASLLRALAGSAVMAIKNAQLYEAELRSRMMAETLSTTSLAVTQSLSLGLVLEALLEHLQRLVPYDTACILLSQSETHLSVQAARDRQGRTGLEVVGATLDISQSPAMQELVNTPCIVQVSDIREHAGISHPLGLAHAMSWVGIPLVAGDQVIGVCIMDSASPGFFDPEHVHLAQALAGQTAVVIQNSWLFEQVRSGRQRLQALAHRLVQGQETERRYIARELHDEAGQALTSLVIGLRLLARDPDSPEEVQSDVAKLETMVDGVLGNLHRLAMKLRPASLDYVGLVGALRQYVETISDQYDLMAQIEAYGLDERLSSDLETAIYRIVQETLTNTVRHARATRVDVLLRRDGRGLLVMVEDNGIGFDPEGEAYGDHLGLIGMRERVEMLGGTLTIESRPGAGTTVRVMIPDERKDSNRR